jgi:hypothetical protein
MMVLIGRCFYDELNVIVSIKRFEPCAQQDVHALARQAAGNV